MRQTSHIHLLGTPVQLQKRTMGATVTEREVYYSRCGTVHLHLDLEPVYKLQFVLISHILHWGGRRSYKLQAPDLCQTSVKLHGPQVGQCSVHSEQQHRTVRLHSPSAHEYRGTLEQHSLLFPSEEQYCVFQITIAPRSMSYGMCSRERLIFPSRSLLLQSRFIISTMK